MSETPTKRGPGRPRKEPTFQQPRIEVLNRRLQSPFGAPSAQVHLKEAGWSCRWFNSAVSADHVYRSKQNGWQPVRPSELVDPEQIGGFEVSPDGFVTRGEKGQEVLMKLPESWREQIATKKAERNVENMKMGRAKQDVATAAGRALGDQAGEFINDNVTMVGDVKDGYERIHRGNELE